MPKLGRRFSLDLVQATLLALTFLSAVSFSLSSLIARIFHPEALPSLIQFQSGTVFLAFLIQAGLRAGLRNQYHLGRKRIVERAENTLLRWAAMATVPVSLICLLIPGLEFFPAFAVLHAVLTLLIGLRIAQGRMRAAAVWSCVTFATIVASCGLITFAAASLGVLRTPIELASLAALGGLAWLRLQRAHSPRALKKVLRESVGLQLGSFAIYLLGFLYSQYVLLLSRDDLALAVAYADVQVLCGVQSLLFSRLFLLVEGRVVRRGYVGLLSIYTLLWTVLWSAGVFAVVAWRRDAAMGAAYAAFTFANLGSIPLGTVSQFLRERYRPESLALALAACVALAACYGVGLQGATGVAAIAAFSSGTVAALLVARSLLAGKGYFIRPGNAVG